MNSTRATDADGKHLSRIANAAAPPARLLDRLITARSKPVVYTALAVLLVFSGFRVGLFIGSWALVQSVGLGDIAQSLLLGLRFDLKSLGYMLLPMVLLVGLIPVDAFSYTWLRWTLNVYAGLMVLLAIAAEIIGTYFFLYYGRRLNSMALQYLEHYHEILGHICNQYPVWLLVVSVLVGLAGSCLLFNKLFWSGRRPRRTRFSRLIHGVVMIALCALAIRGIGREPLSNVNGSTYFTNNNLVNELSRNNLATFASAFYCSVFEPWEEGEFFPFPAASDATEHVADMVYQPNDIPLNDPVNPLWRVTETGRQPLDVNVVLIIMESMAGRSVGALGYQPDYTPNLTRMCEQGMYFENMFAIGYRTNKGLTGLLCSHPDVGGQNLMKRPEAIGRYRTLPVVMAEKGYRTMFFYGGDPEFDNMREFLEQGGMQEMYCQDTMHSGPRGGFGYSWQDEVVFDKTHEVLSQVPSDERFFAVVLTLSNHDPWDVPSGRTPVVSAGEDNPMGRMKNSYRYADWALNRFFEKARETNAPYLQNTLFVLVADHGQQAELNRTKMLDAPGFRIPCLFYAPGMPGLVQRQRISTVCSQIDLAPTLLSFLGGRYEHSFLGRNVLSIAPGDGFAMLRDFEPLGFVRGDKLVIRPPRSWPRLYRLDRTSMKELELSGDNSKLVDALDKDMLSYYGLARYLLGKKAFAAPAAELLAGFEESSSSAKDHHGPVYP